jgi:hypothetical protein
MGKTVEAYIQEFDMSSVSDLKTMDELYLKLEELTTISSEITIYLWRDMNTTKYIEIFARDFEKREDIFGDIEEKSASLARQKFHKDLQEGKFEFFNLLRWPSIWSVLHDDDRDDYLKGFVILYQIVILRSAVCDPGLKATGLMKALKTGSFDVVRDFTRHEYAGREHEFLTDWFSEFVHKTLKEPDDVQKLVKCLSNIPVSSVKRTLRLFSSKLKPMREMMEEILGSTPENKTLSEAFNEDIDLTDQFYSMTASFRKVAAAAAEKCRRSSSLDFTAPRSGDIFNSPFMSLIASQMVKEIGKITLSDNNKETRDPKQSTTKKL